MVKAWTDIPMIQKGNLQSVVRCEKKTIVIVQVIV